jgi:hypothetical protein
VPTRSGPFLNSIGSHCSAMINAARNGRNLPAAVSRKFHVVQHVALLARDIDAAGIQILNHSFRSPQAFGRPKEPQHHE